VTIEVEDDGAPFDPTVERSFTGPNPETGGGVGLALLRSWGGNLAYDRAEGRNHLSLTLRLER